MERSLVLLALYGLLGCVRVATAQRCDVDLARLGNGWCDREHNTRECNWDGGDCCIETCECRHNDTLPLSGAFNGTLPCYDCGNNGYSCRNDTVQSGNSIYAQSQVLSDVQRYLDTLTKTSGNFSDIITDDYEDLVTGGNASEVCRTASLLSAQYMPRACLHSMPEGLDIQGIELRALRMSGGVGLCAGQDTVYDYLLNPWGIHLHQSNVRAVYIQWETLGPQLDGVELDRFLQNMIINVGEVNAFDVGNMAVSPSSAKGEGMIVVARKGTTVKTIFATVWKWHCITAVEIYTGAPHPDDSSWPDLAPAAATSTSAPVDGTSAPADCAAFATTVAPTVMPYALALFAYVGLARFG